MPFTNCRRIKPSFNVLFLSGVVEPFKDAVVQVFGESFGMGLFSGGADGSEEEAELPLLVGVKAVEDGAVCLDAPFGDAVAVHVGAEVKDFLGGVVAVLLLVEFVQDYLPEG